MKKVILILLALFIPLWMLAGPPKKPEFNAMEKVHVHVATPGLFSESNQIYLHLERLKNYQYCFPLKGAKIISPYGRGGGHAGVDLKTRASDTIRAAFAGYVRLSKPYSAYGKIVVIRHEDGLETLYSHNVKNLVKPGEYVHAGQPIALTGRSGRATTEHLHFETRINGQHFNPAILFNLADGTLRKETICCTKAGNGVIVRKVENDGDAKEEKIEKKEKKEKEKKEKLEKKSKKDKDKDKEEVKRDEKIKEKNKKEEKKEIKKGKDKKEKQKAEKISEKKKSQSSKTKKEDKKKEKKNKKDKSNKESKKHKDCKEKKKQ